MSHLQRENDDLRGMNQEIRKEVSEGRRQLSAANQDVQELAKINDAKNKDLIEMGSRLIEVSGAVPSVSTEVGGRTRSRTRTTRRRSFATNS